MRKGSKKKTFRTRRRGMVGISIIIGTLLFSATVFAGEVTNYGVYSGHTLTCTSKCYAGYGTAKTLGAVKPYNNYASVVIYRQDGTSQGTTYATGGQAVGSSQTSQAAVATKYGTNLSKAVTYHAIVDSSGSFTDGFLNQLVYTEYR